MKITKRQLRRIIREEKLKLTENYGSHDKELNSLGAMSSRFAEELESNEAYYRISKGQIQTHPELPGLIEDVIIMLRKIDELKYFTYRGEEEGWEKPK